MKALDHDCTTELMLLLTMTAILGAALVLADYGVTLGVGRLLACLGVLTP